MALVTETGGGSASAESLASVAAADNYHSVRANTAWAALTTALKEAALRKATDYMGQTFMTRWKGYRTTTTQALDWPRADVERVGFYGIAYWANDTVPAPVVNACCELALRASGGELNEDTAQEVLREKIGQIETEYQPGSRAVTRYPAIEGLLAPFLTGAGGVRISKA